MKKVMMILPILFVLVLTTTSCKKNPALTPAGDTGTEDGYRWLITDVAIETSPLGTRLTMTYDPATETFSGTLENNGTTVADQSRVEIHVYNAVGVSQEFGPTTPVNMQPGTQRTITLAAPGTNALNATHFAMHAEVGTQTSGGEGGTETGGN